MDEEKFSNKRSLGVDELNELIYHQKDAYQEHPRRKIHDKNLRLSKDFPEQPELESKNQRLKLPHSFFKKVFFWVLAFFVITVLAVLFSFYNKKETVSNDLISLEIINPPFVDGGDALEVRVRVQNFNVQSLELPDLVFTYPKDAENPNETVINRRSLETIAQGDRVDEQFTIILFGQEGEVRPLKAKLEYRLDGSNAIFVKETEQEVIIRSTPATLSFDAPIEIVQGQELEFTLNLASNSSTVVNNTLLSLQYPRGFEIVATDPQPDFSNNTWKFPSITEDKKSVKIRGYLSALEGQSQTITASFGKQSSERQQEIETIFNRLVHVVDVTKPFISTVLTLNGTAEPKIVIRGKQEIGGEISFINTLSEPIKDARIVLNIQGNLYNPTGVYAQNAFFDSSTGTITWDKTTLPEMSLLEPGVEKTLSFNLPTKELVLEGSALIQPELDLRVTVAGILNNGVSRNALDVSRSKVLANSDISLTARVDHEGGPLQDTGPMPPVVGQTTTYTVTLDVSNSSNEIHNAVAQWFLPPYATWVGGIAPSTERTFVRYDESTRKVTWDLKTLRSGLGIGSSPRSLSFQIGITPSLSQFDKQVPLTSEIMLTGKDTLTSTDLTYKKTPVENRIQNSQEPGADGRVRK